MNSLIGIWMYVSLIYQGQPIPAPNPALKMYYTFQNDSINEIFYFRSDEKGTCKRRAKYEIADSSVDSVAADVADGDVAPANSSSLDVAPAGVSPANVATLNANLPTNLKLLKQTVIEVDSQNADFCSQDTDMQINNFSAVQFEVVEDKMYLLLPLGEETLIYVWERMN